MADVLPHVGRIEHGVSLRERVEEALSWAIQSGSLPPGQVYSAPSLSKMFDVSATPVREAMLNLEKRGFVEILRNKGFRVTEMSRETLQEIVDVRLMLEPPSMIPAAARFPRSREKEFRELAQAVIDAVSDADLARYLAADSEFHLEILRVLGNERLVNVVSDLRKQTRIVGLNDILGTEELKEWGDEHQILVDLLVAGDGTGAEALLAPHIEHIVTLWKPATA